MSYVDYFQDLNLKHLRQWDSETKLVPIALLLQLVDERCFDMFEAFVARQQFGTVFKSRSGTRSEVRRWSSDFLERVSHGSPPVVVQTRIQGLDVRLHSVGARKFATAIESGSAVDYRFEKTPGRYWAHAIPVDIASRCARFAADAGLPIAGFVASDG
jgi:hypothetical protein